MTGVNNNKQVNQVDLNQFKIGTRINQQDSDVKKSIFTKIDKDGDGVIEKDEYQGFVNFKFKGKDGQMRGGQLLKIKSLDHGRSLCVDQAGKQWIVSHDGYLLNEKYVENPEKFMADAKYEQQVQARKAADQHSKNFYGIADDNSGNWGDSVVKMKNYWDKNVNSKNVLQMLDSYQNYLEKEGKSDSSIIDTVTSETGASATEQRVMLTSILQTLCKAAREAGVSEGDIKKACRDFNSSMNTELNAVTRRTNPKDMEKAIDFLRGAIIAKQNAGGEITEKQAIETVAKDFSDQNTKAQKEYKDAREEDGWATSVGDTVCGWFGCTTVEDMDKKLGANAKAAKLLATAKTEEEFKVRYKEVFGIEFDKNKIAARDVALGKYQQANAMNATIKVTDGILANSESKNYATLRAEIKEKFQIDDEIADTIIANYGAVTGKEVKTEADKREMLLHFLKETKSASQSEYQTLTNGKTLEQMGKDLELLHKSAFGTSDIAKDVAQFNENMVVTEMVAESVFEVAGTIALQFVPGLGQMAAAKLAVSAAKWGTKAVKVANAAAKAEKAFAAVTKFQQGAGMTSKIASKAAKVSSSMATTGVATATVGLTNGDDAKAVMRKTLMNMSFAGVGVGANELAPKLMSAFGVNKAIANELAEEIINAAGSYGITKIAGDDYGSSDAFIDLATGMALARLGHIKGGVPDVNAPKPASTKPQIDVEAKPQIDVASAPHRENQSIMRVDRSSSASSSKVVSSREWTSAGVDANGTEIQVRQNPAGSIIVDRNGRKNLVRFAEGQTRVEIGQDSDGTMIVLTKTQDGQVTVSKDTGIQSQANNKLDNRTNSEPRKSSLDTETKPTPVVEKPAASKSSAKYLDKPIENENLAAIARKRYPNASDELKGRLLDIDAAISTIDDPYILSQINKMQDIDEIERLADIMNELNGNYSAYERVLKFQDGNYTVRSNAAEFSRTTREVDATGHKAFMNGEDVTSLSGNDNVKGLKDDLAEETRLYTMKEYLKDNNRRSEISDYLYNKYYLDGLDVSPATKARMQEITSKYNTRVFIGQDTQNVDQVLDKLEKEFAKFEQASNYQCKFPPVVDFNRIRKQYFQRVPGSALSETRTGSLSFSYMDEKALDEALRHELIHSNDKFLKNGMEISADKFPDVFPQNPKIDPETGDYIIDLNECKYADEFRKAGIEDWVIEYAHTEPKEFVAVAAEGDMSKYSLEFQNVLKKMGMPDWAFNLPAPVKNIDASANVGPVHVGNASDSKDVHYFSLEGLLGRKKSSTSHSITLDDTQRWNNFDLKSGNKLSVKANEDGSVYCGVIGKTTNRVKLNSGEVRQIGISSDGKYILLERNQQGIYSVKMSETTPTKPHAQSTTIQSSRNTNQSNGIKIVSGGTKIQSNKIEVGRGWTSLSADTDYPVRVRMENGSVVIERDGKFVDLGRMNNNTTRMLPLYHSDGYVLVTKDVNGKCYAEFKYDDGINEVANDLAPVNNSKMATTSSKIYSTGHSNSTAMDLVYQKFANNPQIRESLQDLDSRLVLVDDPEIKTYAEDILNKLSKQDNISVDDLEEINALVDASNAFNGYYVTLKHFGGRRTDTYEFNDYIRRTTGLNVDEALSDPSISGSVLNSGKKS